MSLVKSDNNVSLLTDKKTNKSVYNAQIKKLLIMVNPAGFVRKILLIRCLKNITMLKLKNFILNFFALNPSPMALVVRVL